LVGSTLVYVSNLPEDKECQKVVDNGETLYLCDGVLYRATYYENEMVYEIVSDPTGEDASAGPTSVVGLSLTDPMTRGDVVRDLQNRLVGAGYDVGGVDGVFGTGTRDALEWYQYDEELEVTAVVDSATAESLGFRPAGQGPSTGSAPSSDAAGERAPTAVSTDVSTEAPTEPQAPTAPAGADQEPSE